MINLNKTVKSWGTPDFKKILLDELSGLGLKHLPLQQGLTTSSVALDHDLKFIILDVKEQTQLVTVKLGIFYYGIIAGCNCADDPSPADEVNEYCEILLRINLDTAQGAIELLS